jgi:methylmalonyl-CoA epimerase
MLKRVHHIDFVVRDMDEAITKYSKTFGIQIDHRLTTHGVDIAHFNIGDTIIVLISPVDHENQLQRFLDEKGEGFYHMGCEVDSLADEVQTMKAKSVHLMNEKPRPGLECLNIELIDLEQEETRSGLTIQLVKRTRPEVPDR